MMKRKVVEHVYCTLMVYIQRDLAKRFNLKKGDELSVEEADNLLILSSMADTKKTVSFSFAGHTESAIRIALINAYRVGADIFKINYKTEEQFDIIRKVIQDFLIGLEVTMNDSGTMSGRQPTTRRNQRREDLR